MAKMTEFFNMGGYALYVWGSFGMTALLMIAEPIGLGRRRQAVLKRLRRLARLGSNQTGHATPPLSTSAPANPHHESQT